jgi:outer membrane protein OmpA-like peptidoglycan-associated protein
MKSMTLCGERLPILASPLRRWRLGALVAAFLAALPLVACGLDPVQWVRGLQGGPPPVDRPPPPNIDQPYPNLAQVPPKPEMPDAATRQKIAQALLADRANAQYEAAKVPLTDPSLPSASPSLFGGAVPPPPPSEQTASATLQAATAPPAPSAPPAQEQVGSASPPKVKPAPRMNVSQAPLAQQAAPQSKPSAVGATPTAGPPQATQAEAGPPEIPQAPPPPPQLPEISGAPTAPTPPPKAPKVAPTLPALSESETKPVAVAFPIGSAVLPNSADADLQKFAARRAGHSVLIIGYGDAETDTPEAQQAAVKLALERARAVAAALTKNGVPMDAIRMEAEPAGHGAAVRLLN